MSPVRALVRSLRRLEHSREDGFGIIEMIISLVVLTVGIAALFLVFAASSLSVARSGEHGTASVITDRIMEYYRRAPWGDIRLLKASVTAAPSLYSTQCSGCPVGASSAVVDEDAGSHDTNNTSTCNAGDTSTDPNVDSTAPITNCLAATSVTGADGRSYEVYTYMHYAYAAGSSSTVDYNTKVVTVIVRRFKSGGAVDTGVILAKTTATFNFQSYTTCIVC
jgi:Tfp pilus assembly protein PilV